MTEHEKTARELFREGYNCAQAVFVAFTDVTGVDFNTALAISSSFGGGMGRLREVCGAVSGAFMVLGMLYGYTDPKSHQEKKEHYALIQKIAARFKEENGSFICRELLGLSTKGADDPEPEKRSSEYYKKRPCEEYVGIAARIVDEYIMERG